MSMPDAVVFLGICLVVSSVVLAAAAVICCNMCLGKRPRQILDWFGKNQKP